MKDKDKLIIESTQKSAEHCNSMIWQVFAIGVALSLYILYLVWPAKANLGAMQFFMAFLGFFILFYSALLIESLGQKKSLMYKILDKKIKNNEFKVIKKLTYNRVDWIAEIILLMVLGAYNYFFGFVQINNSLATFGKAIIFLDLPVFIISLVLSAIVICNWFHRPKEDNKDRNCLEKIRVGIMGNKLKSYNEIVQINVKKEAS